MANTTRTRRNMDIYKRLILEDKSSNPEYTSFMKNLDRIMELQGKIMENPSNAKNKIDGKPMHAVLEAEYKNLVNRGNDLFAQNDSFVNARKHIIRDVIKSVNRDRAIISEAVAKNVNPQDIYKRKRTAVVDISNFSGKAAGGSNSQRIPLKKTDGTKGFFTPFDNKLAEKSRRAIVDRYRDKLPEAVLYHFDKFITGKSWDTMNKPLEHNVQGFKGCYTAADKDQAKHVSDFIQAIGVDMIVSLDVRNNKDILDLTGQLLNDLGKEAFVEGFRQANGLEDGQEIAKRNVTMCEFADMLGCSDVVAKTSYMTVVRNGKTIDGVFMENVEGTDVNRTDINSPAYNVDIDSLNDPKVLHQIADLQILDYITGNVDRHMGNIIFDVQKGEDGKGVLKGIKGIDNDASFTTIEKARNRMVPIKHIKHVSTNVYRFLSNMNCAEKVRNMMLLRGYTRSEALAAEKRVLELRSHVITDHQAEVVGKDEWQKYTLAQLSSKETAKHGKREISSNNMFSRISDKFHSLQKYTEADKKEVMGDEIIFEDAQQVEKLTVQTNMLAKFAKHSEKMSKIDMLRKPSQEFKEMRDSLKSIQDFVKDRGADTQLLSEDDKKQLAALTNTLVDKCSTYISLKRIVPKTAVGQQRQAYAYDLHRFAQNMLDKNFNFDIEADLEEENKKLFDQPAKVEPTKVADSKEAVKNTEKETKPDNTQFDEPELDSLDI